MLLFGIVAAALAATLRDERQRAIRIAWAVALVGLLFAALGNGSGWTGPAMLVYGLALLCAAAIGAEGIRTRMASLGFGWKQPVAVLIALASVLAPLYAAVSWMITGAAGPLERRNPEQVPAFVAEEAGTSDRARTLVLDGTPGHVDYSLVRGSGAELGDADLAAAAGEDKRLGGIVAHLVAGSGADQTNQLGGYAVRYVLVRGGAPREMGRVLDSTPGLTRLSQDDGSALWRVDRRVSRVSIVAGEAKDGTSAGEAAAPVPVPSGPVEAHTKVPAGADGRVLRLADAADEGWQATLNGTPLKPRTVDGWAQGFTLPAGGGTSTSPTRTRSATPSGCGRRACSPSSWWSWRCRAAAGRSTTTCPRTRLPRRPPRRPATAAGPGACGPRPRPRAPRGAGSGIPGPGRGAAPRPGRRPDGRGGSDGSRRSDGRRRPDGRGGPRPGRGRHARRRRPPGDADPYGAVPQQQAYDAWQAARRASPVCRATPATSSPTPPATLTRPGRTAGRPTRRATPTRQRARTPRTPTRRAPTTRTGTGSSSTATAGRSTSSPTTTAPSTRGTPAPTRAAP
ncbi:hypothetical protein O1L68_25625 [Streptomyces lydicus]|nr:hypothetical protein [Streptomyces lydicus]